MNLQEEWSTLVEPSHAAWTWRVLSALYTEPHRAYHNLDHVQDCLRTQLRWAGSHDPIVSLALFFHDAVYVPGDKRNEELSAGLLRAVGGVLRLSHGDVERAVVAVLATRSHETTADDEVSQTVIDVDLSILGCSEPGYDAYVQQIRREYGHVSEEAWRHGRGGFLAEMLMRTVFKTTWAIDAFEERAKKNMARELNDLNTCKLSVG